MIINESGMSFGPFDEEKVFYIENSEIYNSIKDGVKTVEFVYARGKDQLLFVEAKMSSPAPGEGNTTQKFDEYIEDITEKFIHSFNLWLTMHLGRRIGDAPRDTIDCDPKTESFTFALVINGHAEAWLPPIRAALERRMIAERKIWNHEVIVLNDKQAETRGLIVR